MSDQIVEFSRYVESAVQEALRELDAPPDSRITEAYVTDERHQLEHAERFADLGWSIPPDARFQLARRILRIRSRLLRFVTDPQTEFNRSILRYLRDSNPRNPAMEASLGTVIDQLASEIDDLKAEVKRAGNVPEPEHASIQQDFTPAKAQEVSDQFYAEHQERFRGPRELVMERQAAYLDVVQDLLADPSSPVVDLGCGRGEWLELLSERGIPAYGVEINRVFIEGCRQRSLEVREVGANEHLAKLSDASVGAITAFHLVEHLTLEDLQTLIDRCMRALRPGGAVIFETPNPANINVSLSSFYLDPTHRAPLPPLLLEFLLSRRGFVDVEIRYLNPTAQYSVPIQADEPGPEASVLLDNINRAFFGAQDYAVVAYKPAAP